MCTHVNVDLFTARVTGKVQRFQCSSTLVLGRER